MTHHAAAVVLPVELRSLTLHGYFFPITGSY
jgi:hypothetical protein